ncbi:MAG: hypothetical protein WC582_02630 [Patescibacteria group bacterium]
MSKKIRKIIIFGVLIICLAFGATVYFSAWMTKKADKITLGLARPDFPFGDYSEEELAKMYPQVKNADVATRTTPEETYAKFRQALEDNNLEMALEQLSKDSKNYKENKEVLIKAHKEGKFSGALSSYPENVWRGTFGESLGQLCYNQKHEDGEFVGCSSFIKGNNGDWKIDTL